MEAVVLAAVLVLSLAIAVAAAWTGSPAMVPAWTDEPALQEHAAPARQPLAA